MSERRRRLFEEESVLRAVVQLALPTIISQIILVLYNMADTFFIGLTNSDAKLSAVTVCLPAFMLLSAIANLFGIGGAAAISRALGAGDRDRAQAVSSFSFWGCLLTALAYSLLVLLFRGRFAYLLGALHGEVRREAVSYLSVTVVLGGAATALNSLLSHLVRSEGRAVKAGIGVALGGVLNIALDPLFMFCLLPPGKEVLGAAQATMLSNLVACGYFLALLPRLRRRGSVLNLRFRPASWDRRTVTEVLKTGLPACLMTSFENVSYAVLDHLIAYGGIAMQAGVGVAKKINMLAHSIVRGMAQGVLPLIAYNYGCGNGSRMRRSVLTGALFSVLLATLCMIGSLVLAQPLVDIFTERGASQRFGVDFLRILCLGCPFSAFGYVVISYMQAVNENGKSFLLAVLRKGVLDIPMMFLLFRLVSVESTVWATPAADLICCVTAILLFLASLRRLAASRDQGEERHSAIRRPRDGKPVPYDP